MDKPRKTQLSEDTNSRYILYADLLQNFIGKHELNRPTEKRVWIYQARRLISLCLFILGKCDNSHQASQDIVALTSLAMRFAIVLTDMKGWKSIADDKLQDADIAVKDLIQFMGSKKSGLYNHVRSYTEKLDAPFSLQMNRSSPTDDRFLITATALTLALRPIQTANLNDLSDLDGHYAAEKYCVFLLAIPWLARRLPAALLPALQHKSILSPCFRTILVTVTSLCHLFTLLVAPTSVTISESVNPFGIDPLLPRFLFSVGWHGKTKSNLQNFCRELAFWTAVFLFFAPFAELSLNLQFMFCFFAPFLGGSGLLL